MSTWRSGQPCSPGWRTILFAFYRTRPGRYASRHPVRLRVHGIHSRNRRCSCQWGVVVGISVRVAVGPATSPIAGLLPVSVGVAIHEHEQGCPAELCEVVSSDSLVAPKMPSPHRRGKRVRVRGRSCHTPMCRSYIGLASCIRALANDAQEPAVDGLHPAAPVGDLYRLSAWQPDGRIAQVDGRHDGYGATAITRWLR